jgi:hypothetical protein
MKPFFLIKTLNNNYYMFNFRKKLILYCHPLLVQIFLLWKENKQEFIIKNLTDRLNEYDKKSITYYYNKIKALSEAGFLDNNEVRTEVDKKIFPKALVRSLIRNLQVF